MDDDGYIEFYDDEEDPNLLPDDLKAIWLWLCEQGDRAHQAAAEASIFRDDHETSDYWLRHALALQDLRNAVFDTDRERQDELRRQTAEKLDMWKAIVTP